MTDIRKTPENRCSSTLVTLAVLALAVLLGSPFASANEGNGTSYPVGSETVFPGMAPPPGKTILNEYTEYYSAEEMAGSRGQNVLPGMHLHVFANALMLRHNWGVGILGGKLMSGIAVPLVYQRISAPGLGRYSKTGIANTDLQLGALTYQKGNLFWYYGPEIYLPSSSFNKNDAMNVGQHNFSVAGIGALTWLPNRGATELGTKTQFTHNLTNRASHYRSGNEFISDFVAMQSLNRKVAVGFNGYFLQQLTDDCQDGHRVGDGHRGRNLSIGPQLRAVVGRNVIAVKYQRDTLTQNRPHGNAFWFEMGIPLGRWPSAQ